MIEILEDNIPQAGVIALLQELKECLMRGEVFDGAVATVDLAIYELTHQYDALDEYCKKAADVCEGLSAKAMDTVGHGSSANWAIGAVAWFGNQEEMWRCTIPGMIRKITEDRKLSLDEALKRMKEGDSGGDK